MTKNVRACTLTTSTTVKLLNIQTPEKFLRFEQCGSTIYRLMSPEDANGIANSVNPDQTTPLGVV